MKARVSMDDNRRAWVALGRNRSGGFTLIATLIANGILVSGLVAVAYLLFYAIGANMATQRQTSATLLLHNKMEELRAIGFSSLTPGGSLDPDNPATHYWDYVSITTSGTITSDTWTTHAPFLRLWQISGTNAKLISVIVYAENAA